jgi:hypothetical protein
MPRLPPHFSAPSLTATMQAQKLGDCFVRYVCSMNMNAFPIVDFLVMPLATALLADIVLVWMCCQQPNLLETLLSLTLALSGYAYAK